MTEILKDISIIIVSISAIYGIVAWRREHVGKRKIDLAEEVLCSIYEIKDIIRYMRSPFSYGGEGSTRKKAKNENPETSKIYDNAYIVHERYNEHADLFNNFYKLRYRYMANFGKDAENPFKTIKNVINEIFGASRMLGMIYWQDRVQNFRPEVAAKRLEEMEKYEKVFWEIEINDKLNGKIDSAINICEEICKSANSPGFKKIVTAQRN